MSTYKAHIFKQRSVGEREEVKLKIFGPDGSPLDLENGGSGGGEEDRLYFFGGAGANLDNGGAIVPLEFDPPLPYGPAGMYLGKITAQWDTGNPTSGYASVSLVHIPDSNPGTFTTICLIELYADESGAGDGVLTPGGCEMTKIDFRPVTEDGHFEVHAFQVTDQHPMPVWAIVTFAKL